MSTQTSKPRKSSWVSARFGRRQSSRSAEDVVVINTLAQLMEDIATLRTALKSNLSRPHVSTGNANSFFITLPTVQQIIDRDNLRAILSPYSWYDESLVEYAWKQSLMVIATLIYIEWTSWQDFKRLFLDLKDQSRRPKRGDHYLPFQYDDLAFLESTGTQKLFDEDQYIFCPLIIKEDHDDIFGARVRLPFTQCLETRHGAFGKVRKMVIEKHQIEYRPKQGRELFKNIKATVMALKTIEDHDSGAKSFTVERRILNQFKRASAQSQGICMNFSTFVHGDTLNIISQWADFDLFDFLIGNYEDFPVRARLFTLRALFEQVRGLAVALRFLHAELDIDGPVSCAHLDLKPENILVEWPVMDDDDRGESPRRTEMPVGQWKINDFGISSVRSTDEEAGIQGSSRLAPGDIHVMHRDRSSIPAPRGPGPFLPPEMKIVKKEEGKDVGPRVSKASDMWSLGCILAMVLAFGLGGPLKAGELYHRRDDGYPDDYFYTDDEPPEVKAEVVAWFDEQATAPEFTRLRPLISECTSLVFDLLKMNRTDRPLADAACKHLLKIRKNAPDDPVPWRPETDPAVITFKERQYPQREPSRSSMTPAVTRIRTGLTRVQTPPVPLQTVMERTTTQLDVPISPPTARRPSTTSTTWTMELATADKTTQQALVSPSTDLVGFVGPNKTCVFDMASLQARWALDGERPKCVDINEVQSACQIFTCETGRKWTSGIVSGPFLVLLSVSSQGSGNDAVAHLYHLKYPVFNPQDPPKPVTREEIPETYEQIVLSSQGHLIVLDEEEINLMYSCDGPTGATPIIGDLLTASFTTDGKYFCAWYKTRKTAQGEPLSYCWGIWHTAAMQLQKTQSIRVPPQPQRGTSASYVLVPCNHKPAFLAVDNFGNSWLVSKHGLVQPIAADHVCPSTVAGAALPDDDAVILLRKTATGSKPKIDLARISSGRSANVSVRSLAQLEHPYAADESGLAVVLEGEATCLVTAHADGRIYRRTLHEGTV